MRRLLSVATLLFLLTGLLASGPAAAAEPHRHIEGTIGTAKFVVELPEKWNGTLVLFSHGYWPTGFAPPDIWLGNRPPELSQTRTWLLDHGYALAASEFTGVSGFVSEPALRDQIALLDWFGQHIGPPRRTISTGQSFGASIASQLAERNPGRFAGVLTTCGEFDPNGTWNTALDMLFTIKHLLVKPEDQDIDLVRARDPQHSNDVLTAAATEALNSKEGRARIALAAAYGNLPGWFSADDPAPTALVDRITAQAQWLGAYLIFAGPKERATDLERRAGGNPSFNVGIDYRHQLAKSAQSAPVREAYRAAGLDLDADLAKLNAAPRIAPDPAAVTYIHRFAVPSGRTPVPVITLHTPRDGGAVSDHEQWYAQQVRRHGDPGKLRQLFADRGMHCAFSDAEELVALRALIQRIDTGHWPDLGPAAANRAAAAYPEAYQQVLDLTNGKDKAMPPAFVSFNPPRSLRPSR